MATITAVGTGPWTTAGTWDAGVPTGADAVVINATFVVTISTAITMTTGSVTVGSTTAGSLTIASGGSLTIQTGASLAVAVNGCTLTVASGGTLNYAGSAALTIGTMAVLVISGTMTVTAGGLTLGGTLNPGSVLDTTGTLTISGCTFTTLALPISGVCSIGSAGVVTGVVALGSTGSFYMNSGSTAAVATSTWAAGSLMVLNPGGTLTLTGNLTAGSVVFAGGSLIMKATGTYTIRATSIHYFRRRSGGLLVPTTLVPVVDLTQCYGFASKPTLIGV